MRSFFLILVFNLLATVAVLAQTVELSIEPAQVEKHIVVDDLDLDFEDISTIQLTNMSSTPLRLRYDKIIDLQPEGWETIVYRKEAGNRPGTNASESGVFSLGAYESVEFYLILQPNGVPGAGRIRLPFVNANLPGRPLATAAFNLTVLNQSQADNDPSYGGRRPSLRVYPNPAVENFFVDFPPNKPFGRVEVYNTLGRRLRSFTEPAGEEGYNIEDLPEGLYLINIYDAAGMKLKTLRLLHRRFGA